MANVKFETTRVALSTAAATNTQDITISGFGTPSAAIFILSGGTTDDTLAAGGVLSIGWTDGTTDKAHGIHIEDNVSTTNTAYSYRNAVITVPDISGTGVDADFSFNTWITDGVRITVDSQADAAWLLTVIFIGGTDVANVYVGEHDDLGSGTSAVDITSVGFEPDLVFMGCQSSATADFEAAIASLSFGIGINDGVDTQRSITFNDYDAQSGAINTGVISNDSITGQPGYSSMSWEGAIGAYDASGFSITPEANSSFAIVSFLAIEFSNSPSLDLFDMTWPTSSGYAETTPNFEPGFGLIVSMMGPSSRNTATTTGLYGVSLAAFDTNGIYTTNLTSEDAANPSNVNSMSSDQLRILDNTGADEVIASSYAFDSQGWDFTLSTNPAASLLGFGLAVEGGTDVNVNAGTETITFTTHQADVVVGINIGAALETITFTTNPASIDLDYAIQTASLLFTTYPATIGGEPNSSLVGGATGGWYYKYRNARKKLNRRMRRNARR